MKNKVKTTAIFVAVNQALKYLEKDPESNIPKRMKRIDKVTPDGYYATQPRTFREPMEEKNHWYQLLMKGYKLGSGDREADFKNFILNAGLLESGYVYSGCSGCKDGER